MLLLQFHLVDLMLVYNHPVDRVKYMNTFQFIYIYSKQTIIHYCMVSVLIFIFHHEIVIIVII